MTNERDKYEKNHRKKKTILRTVGVVLVLGGLAAAIYGFVDMGLAFSGNDFRVPKFWLFFIGFPAIAIGGFLLTASFQRAINRYVKDENAPVFNEMGQQIAPGLSSISEALHKGAEKNVCISCGALVDKDAKFCDNCGAPMKKICPKCGTDNSATAKFCDNCGAPLNS